MTTSIFDLKRKANCGLVIPDSIGAMTKEEIAMIRNAQEESAKLPQVPIETRHVLHAGMYVRTITIPANVFLIGVLIKRSTVLTISGHVWVYIGGEAVEIKGYKVLTAAANRKQAFLTTEETQLTMSFATQAKTVEEAEAEFTDEVDTLSSRHPTSINHITITGD